MEIVENRENYVVIKKELLSLTGEKVYSIFICFSYLTPIAYFDSKKEEVIASNNITTRNSIQHLINFCGDRKKILTAQVNINRIVQEL